VAAAVFDRDDTPREVVEDGMTERPLARAVIRLGRLLVGAMVFVAIVLLYLTVLTRAGIWH
jgi:hypothetical protein